MHHVMVLDIAVAVMVGGRGSSTCVGVPDVDLLLSVDIGDRTTVWTWCITGDGVRNRGGGCTSVVRRVASRRLRVSADVNPTICFCPQGRGGYVLVAYSIA
jgi:hypothetical protein